VLTSSVGRFPDEMPSCATISSYFSFLAGELKMYFTDSRILLIIGLRNSSLWGASDVFYRLTYLADNWVEKFQSCLTGQICDMSTTMLAEQPATTK